MSFLEESDNSDAMKLIGALFLIVIGVISVMIISDLESGALYFPIIEKGKLFLPCLVLFLLELTGIIIIYYILKTFFNSSVKEYFIPIAIVALGYAVYNGNSVFSVYANARYSLPQAETYIIYAPVINKNHYVTRSGKKGDKKVDHWEITLKSWFAENDGISFEITKSLFDTSETSDIFAVKIRKGLLHIDFIDNISTIKRLKRSEFVEKSKFPMSEEEAQKHLIANLENQENENE